MKGVMKILSLSVICLSAGCARQAQTQQAATEQNQAMFEFSLSTDAAESVPTDIRGRVVQEGVLHFVQSSGGIQGSKDTHSPQQDQLISRDGPLEFRANLAEFKGRRVIIYLEDILVASGKPIQTSSKGGNEDCWADRETKVCDDPRPGPRDWGLEGNCVTVKQRVIVGVGSIVYFDYHYEPHELRGGGAGDTLAGLR